MKTKKYEEYWDSFDKELYKKFVKAKHDFKRLTEPKSMEELKMLRQRQQLAGQAFSNNN